MLAALAEGVGFEPTDACASPVFKTGAIDHSATLPASAVNAGAAGRPVLDPTPRL